MAQGEPQSLILIGVQQVALYTYWWDGRRTHAPPHLMWSPGGDRDVVSVRLAPRRWNELVAFLALTGWRPVLVDGISARPEPVHVLLPVNPVRAGDGRTSQV